jgi:cytochrome c oxidase assembly protein subunit 15
MTNAIVVADERRRLLRRMAQAGLLLTVLIVVLSAYVRHRGVGLGCEDWPACYGQDLSLVQQGQAVATDGDVLLARVVHRVVATVMLVLVIAMVFSSLARPRLRREGTLASGLLALALALAVLGVVTPGSRLPAVALGNLLGGFAMLALCARLVAVTGEPRPRDVLLMRMAILVAILLVLEIALGALVSAVHAGLSCRSLAECTALTASGGWNFSGLDPWQLPSPGVLGLASEAAGAPVQWAHRIGGVVATAAVLVLGLLAWQGGQRRTAVTLVGLLLGVMALGFFIGEGDLPLPAVLLHNLGSAGLLAMVAVTGFEAATSTFRISRASVPRRSRLFGKPPEV